MASLPAEKAAPRELFFKADWEELAACWPENPLLHEKLAKLGYCVKDGVIERLPGEKAEKSWGAFEPFEYTERS